MLEITAMEKTISWNHLGVAKSIQEGIAELKFNKDIGWQQTLNLMPQSDDFHHWMHYAYMLTLIHNRDLSPKRYSIIRVVIILVLLQFRDRWRRSVCFLHSSCDCTAIQIPNRATCKYKVNIVFIISMITSVVRVATETSTCNEEADLGHETAAFLS